MSYDIINIVWSFLSALELTGELFKIIKVFAARAYWNLLASAV